MNESENTTSAKPIEELKAERGMRGSNVDEKTCQHHEWVVFSTALKERWLMLQCAKCGILGTVGDPSEEEWSVAFHAPSRPYSWHDDARVVVKGFLDKQGQPQGEAQ